MTFPLLEIEDLIRIIETDTILSCPYEATKAVLALLTFAIERESSRTPPSLYADVGAPVVRPPKMTQEEIVSCLKFITVKRLELTFGTLGLEIGWDRITAWCLDMLGTLIPRIFGRSKG